MPIVTPTLNLPQTAISSSGAAKPAILPPPAPAVSTGSPARMPDAPSTTVTLSPQALSVLASAAHPSPPSSGSGAPTPPAAAHAGSLYESLKNGISTGVADVGDAIASGAHAVVDGVETTLSTANKVVTGMLELPFAVVAKGCDAVGSVIDEL